MTQNIPLRLKIAREYARNGQLSASTLTNLIQHPKQMGQFLSYYWKEGRQPISYQVRKGLIGCFYKFSEKQFAECKDDSANIKIRDILFLTHARPKTREQEVLFKKIAEDKL